jgi:hypothetical protein
VTEEQRHVRRRLLHRQSRTLDDSWTALAVRKVDCGKYVKWLLLRLHRHQKFAEMKQENATRKSKRGNMKKVIISMACCAAIAPLAFGQDPQKASGEERGVTVTAPSAAVKIEGGETARYQPPKTLVVQTEGSGRYVLNGRGRVFNSKGEVVGTKVRPGTRVHVHFAGNGDGRTIDRVVVD